MKVECRSEPGGYCAVVQGILVVEDLVVWISLKTFASRNPHNQAAGRAQNSMNFCKQGLWGNQVLEYVVQQDAIEGGIGKRQDINMHHECV